MGGIDVNVTLDVMSLCLSKTVECVTFPEKNYNNDAIFSMYN